MTIWKFDLETTDQQVIQMPQGAMILSVQTQRGYPRMWALVNPAAEMGGRKINIHGTGHDVTEGGAFIGTYQLSGGALVFHVFDAGEIHA